MCILAHWVPVLPLDTLMNASPSAWALRPCTGCSLHNPTVKVDKKSLSALKDVPLYILRFSAFTTSLLRVRPITYALALERNLISVFSFSFIWNYMIYFVSQSTRWWLVHFIQRFIVDPKRTLTRSRSATDATRFLRHIQARISTAIKCEPVYEESSTNTKRRISICDQNYENDICIRKRSQSVPNHGDCWLVFFFLLRKAVSTISTGLKCETQCSCCW